MSLQIIKAGILDTIQDAGRNGYRHLGINPSGVMDHFSAQLCNALLGKNLKEPVIELHFPASVVLFQKPTIVCLAGADFSATINNQHVPLHQPFLVSENTILQFNRLNNGAQCYLSLLHKMQLDYWLGSASTNLKAAAGGWKGRKLMKEDQIFFTEQFDLTELAAHAPVRILPWKVFSLPLNKNIDCIKGREWNWLASEAQTVFQTKSFVISNLSDRMGYRLYGEELKAATSEQLISSAVDFGTMQLLPNGQLIVLMADHQTTGGYPRVAYVSSAALPSLAQLSPGNEIHFQFISLEQAEQDFIQQQKYLEQLQNACKLKMEKLLHASM